MDSMQAPNLVFKPLLLKFAIIHSHKPDNPILFDMSKDLQRFSDDAGEWLRIGAMMFRDLHDNAKTRERVFKTVTRAIAVLASKLHGICTNYMRYVLIT